MLWISPPFNPSKLCRVGPVASSRLARLSADAALPPEKFFRETIHGGNTRGLQAECQSESLPCPPHSGPQDRMVRAAVHPARRPA